MMDLEGVVPQGAGLDVHKKIVVVTVLTPMVTYDPGVWDSHDGSLGLNRLTSMDVSLNCGHLELRQHQGAVTSRLLTR
ncbi:hypothetical protein [Sulfobacillus sp. hq2]|uniref:hypothetical protein n=1 Tax=Sulfobacillus sp. hq2 TaxID=2039167 RepID=UPI001FA8EFCC|nr:hypothetical protein [Sulfobacillus sp. hq2]